VPSYTSQQIPSRQPSQIAPSQTKASQANRIDQETAIPGATGGGGAGGGGSRPWMLIGLVGVLVLAALVWVPRLVRGGLRRRRWAAATTPALRAEAGWAELRDSALDLGLAWDDSVTLRHRARDLARAFGRGDTTDALARGEVRGPNADPEATGALHRLVRRVERARFARAGLLADTPTGEAAEPGAASAGAAEPAGPSVQEDVARCVEAMRAGASRRRQTQATWLPMSLLAGLRGWGRTGSSGPGPRALVTEPGVDRAV